MTTDGAMKEDVKLPEGKLGDEIKEAFDKGDVLVTVTAAMGEEQVCSSYSISQFSGS